MASKIFALLLLILAARPDWAQSQPAPGAKSKTDAEISLHSAGSTVINPLMQLWVKEYHRLHPGVQIEYQAIGSGGGIRTIITQQVSFGVTEIPMTDEQLAQAKGRVLHIPISLRGVVPIYNLPQVRELRFSGNTLADIFLGKITKWDDHAIANDNPGVKLPDMAIYVVHHFPRRNSNGNSIATANYLAKISPPFKTTLDASDGTSWPVPTGFEKYPVSSGDVAGVVDNVPGSIAWVDLVRVSYEHMQYAAVKDSDGEFVKATIESITAAAAAGVPVIQKDEQDFRLFITNEPGKATYPVSSFIWMILYDDDKDKKQHEAMLDFLKWILTDGQKLAPKLGYPPLPPELVELELKAIR